MLFSFVRIRGFVQGSGLGQNLLVFSIPDFVDVYKVGFYIFRYFLEYRLGMIKGYGVNCHDL